jgi:hypothetical protein
MAVVQNTYTGNGSTVLYSLSFPYLEQTDVKVSVNGTIVTNYIFATASSIQFLTAPSAGAAIVIYRETYSDETSATIFPGSAIKAADLNNNFTQILYVAQEVVARAVSTLGSTMSGILNMGGFRITNLGSPVNSTDASTKAYVDSNVGAVSASATAAAASASAAATSASNASSSASSAASSASSASTSASNAASSASSALSSANSATSSASAASTSASNAATSASNASTSETNAANSATSAASSAASALAAFDSFDDRYLGAKASDPSVDNDGDPLTSGDLYWNSTLSVMKVYTGSAWVIAYVPGDAANISFTPYSTIASNNVQGAVQELTDEKLNLTGGTMTGNITFNGAQTFPGVVASSGGTLTGDVTLSNQSDLRFGEATANGSNYVAFQAPASIAADVVWTLPATDAAVSGHALKSNAAGQLSWGTAGGAAGGGTDDVFYENAQTVTTSYTLTAGKNALSAGPITINAGAVITVPSNASWIVL